MTRPKTSKQHFFEDMWKHLAVDGEMAVPWTAMETHHAHFLIRHLKQAGMTGRVLDLGCGMGRETIPFARAGFESHGIDFAPAAVHKAEEHLAGIEEELPAEVHYMEGNVLELPYKDAFFDAVNDVGCFGHIAPEDRELYLSNVCRVLREHGYLRMRVIAGAPGYAITSTGFPLRFTQRQLLELFKDRFDLCSLLMRKLKTHTALDVVVMKK